MRYLYEKAGFVWRLALLTLLLAVQTMALAHELDHVGLPDNPRCAVCSLGGGLSGPVTVEHEAWEPAPAEPVTVAPGLRPETSHSLTPPPARAPPASTLRAIT